MMYTKVLRFLALQTVFCLSLLPFTCSNYLFMAHAENWTPQIRNAALPQRIVAVDKSRQQFYLYQKNTPFKLTHNYPCTTGQIDGDKQVTNDKRTPEGVYFVDYKISKGLDFKEYGGIAYTLNYPNPVDKLRGKTGYGIWIHSKGDGIKPRITRGCVAIGLDEIATVGHLLTSGTAVVIGESLDVGSVPILDDGTAEHLRRQMEQWTRAWASRSHSLFDFYDGESYSKAMPETFEAFRLNKERLFKRLKWINIFNKQVHVLEGPGYWVTWSEQFYRAPNLSTEGIRRLYWQKDANNVFRIVGMEWIRSDVGMEAAFNKGELVASTDKSTSDASTAGDADETPSVPSLTMPEQADATPAVKSDTKVAATQPAKETPAVSNLPAKGTLVSMDDKPSPTGKPATPAAKKSISITPELTAIMQKNITAWQKAWQNRNAESFYAFYDSALYGNVAGQKNESAFHRLKGLMNAYFKRPWIEMLITDGKILAQGDSVVTSMNQWIFVPKKKPFQGQHTLYWQKNAQGKWRIVASKWEDSKATLQAAYLESISAPVNASLEAWRKDWLTGDVDKYVSHYADKARQGGRNKNGIAAHKNRVWKKAAPAKVQLTGIRIQLVPEGIQADMLQVYEDTNGKGDKGTKTLLLIPTQDGWKIAKENWVKLR